MPAVPKQTHQKKISKDETWAKVRNQLKKDFEAMGITKCELRLGDCTNGRFLGFAHTTKRRDAKDLKRVVLACTNCHSKVEFAPVRWTGMTMEKCLNQVIANRKNRNMGMETNL